MKSSVTNERGHFLNDAQKNVKREIMLNLLNGLFGEIQKNSELFPEPQHITDLIFSVLIMFNRDTLAHTFETFKLTDQGSKIMRQLFEAVRKEVVDKLRVGKN